MLVFIHPPKLAPPKLSLDKLIGHIGQGRQGSQLLLALACIASTKRPLLQTLIPHFDVLEAPWSDCRRGAVGGHGAKLGFGDGIPIGGALEGSQAWRGGGGEIRGGEYVVGNMWWESCGGNGVGKVSPSCISPRPWSHAPSIRTQHPPTHTLNTHTHAPKPLELRPSKLNLRLPKDPCLMVSPGPCLMGSRPN